MARCSGLMKCWEACTWWWYSSGHASLIRRWRALFSLLLVLDVLFLWVVSVHGSIFNGCSWVSPFISDFWCWCLFVSYHFVWWSYLRLFQLSVIFALCFCLLESFHRCCPVQLSNSRVTTLSTSAQNVESLLLLVAGMWCWDPSSLNWTILKLVCSAIHALQLWSGLFFIFCARHISAYPFPPSFHIVFIWGMLESVQAC